MDDVDLANDRVTEMEEDKIASIRRAAANIPQGSPGVCDGCGGTYSRLVGGYCGKCRDGKGKRAA